MQIQENVSLAPYSTMRLGGDARFLAEVTDEDELVEALTFANEKQLATHIVGDGSNTVFGDKGFDGLVIVVSLIGVTKKASGEALLLDVSSGENWDGIVQLSVNEGFCDIAALSAIPGTAGAAPVQNIGAYGQQVSDSLVSVRAYDTTVDNFVTISRQDCNFSYRGSRFNTGDRGRFIITQITLRLSHTSVGPPFYQDLSAYFEHHAINQNAVSPSQLREAVTAIRAIKLPNPSVVANNGSFFRNPVVSANEFENLKQTFPELKAHKTDDGNLKLYGAQLIELVGMKDYHSAETGMATWKNQALVLVNESAKTTSDLLQFKQTIVDSVYKKFGVTLTQEPEFVEK